MTEVLTVPTHFEDISELSQGLADRVEDERLILYGPDAYEEGAQIGFAILLVDGNPALEGLGRVAASLDGGDERAPETRFDIVLDALELEGMSQAVFERIVMTRHAEGEPATGEIPIDELEASAELAVEASGELEAPAEEEFAEAVAEEAVAEEAAAEEAVAEEAVAEEAVAEEAVAEEAVAEEAASGDEGLDEAHSFESDAPPVDHEALAAERVAATAPSVPTIAPPAAERPSGFTLEAPASALTRPSREPVWWPAPAEPPPRVAPSGYFAYSGSLPIPAEPPRPELDEAYRIGRAPRPGEAPERGLSRASDDQAAPAQAAADVAEDDALDEEAAIAAAPEADEVAALDEVVSVEDDELSVEFDGA
ncbi:MAG: hypothetical protein OEY14_05675 [Myxococcales bacterium]|nr:hypothetical protein [Myxococcales bacterium]